MKKINLSSLLCKGIVFLEIILLIVLLWFRFKLGLTRYFDIDEYAHLHWGYSLYIGERPYTDFFYLFPPFFLYPIASLFAIFGRSLVVLTKARLFIFFIFVLSIVVLFLLSRKLRGSLVGLMTVVIFAFLPLPSDKMIEVRPDLVATFLAMLGLLLFIKGEEEKDKADRSNKINKGNKWYFFSGLLYATSLGFVPKTVFFLLPLAMVVGYKLLSSLKWFEKKGTLFLVGFLPPAVVLLLLIFSYGNPSLAIYSMSKMASDITALLGKRFYMRPDIFFYQNETYYGLPGYSLSYIVNLIIYLTASFFAIFRFIQSLSFPDDKKCLREFLVGAAFFANLYAHIFVYPLKHAQYLIPLAPFIAFYFADFIEEAKKSKLLTPFGVNFLILPFVLLIIATAGIQMYERKMQWSNKPTFDKLAILLKSVPADAAIFDLTGESIFFRNGYYFCCLPYGQYEEALGFNLPNLEREMEKRNTKFVHTGWSDRIYTLPSFQRKYLKEHFVPYFSDGSLLIKK